MTFWPPNALGKRQERAVDVWQCEVRCRAERPTPMFSGALNLLTFPAASSKRVATVWTTERDSESGSDVPVIAYVERKRENVHESRSFRGV